MRPRGESSVSLGFPRSDYTALMVGIAVTEAISALAGAWGWPATAAQMERIGAYFETLLQWNARVNLTGARSMDELIGEHLPDSFALARLVPAGARVADVGAGGGLPGVPFSVLRPDCRALLVEPRAKRVAFLGAARRCVEAAAVFEVARCRHDELSEGSFDVACSRATFQPEEWLALARPLLASGGRVVVFAAKGVVAQSSTWELAGSVEYATAQGAPRWAGVFVPRGTFATTG